MKKMLLFTLLVSLMMAGSVLATPLNTAGMSLTELQTGVFDAIGSTIDVNADETGSEVFAAQSQTANALYVATLSYSASDLVFGMYDVNDTTSRLKLFDTSVDGVGTNYSVAIDFTANVGFTSYEFGIPNNTVIDTAIFSGNAFGFYITSTSGTYFSQSDSNVTEFADLDGDGQNDNDHFLTYQGNGDMVTLPGASGYALNDLAHWYVAAEATPINNNSDDFTDFVAHFESFQPVPEPTTLLLLGSGLVGLAFLKRRKS